VVLPLRRRPCLAIVLTVLRRMRAGRPGVQSPGMRCDSATSSLASEREGDGSGDLSLRICSHERKSKQQLYSAASSGLIMLLHAFQACLAHGQVTA